MSKLLSEIRQKWVELKQKVRAAMPGWFKTAWVVIGSLIVCAIIGGAANALLGQKAGSNLHLLLNTAAGALVYPPVSKLLGKLVRR